MVSSHRQPKCDSAAMLLPHALNTDTGHMQEGHTQGVFTADNCNSPQSGDKPLLLLPACYSISSSASQHCAATNN